MILTEGTTGTKTVVEYPRKSVCVLLMNQASVAATVPLGVTTEKMIGMKIVWKKIRRINAY